MKRLPLIQQVEGSECGLACLAMVAGYHGHRTDLGALRRRFPSSGRGANLVKLIDAAGKLGFACRPLRLDLGALAKLQLPAVIHWDLRHFVVLKDVRRSHVVVHDPGAGRRRLTHEEFGAHFTGVALEMTPTQGFERKNDVLRLRVQDLWSKAVGLRRGYAQMLALSAAMLVLTLALPFYAQLALDEAVVRADAGLLKILALGFFLLGILRYAIEALRGQVALYLGSTLGFQVGVNLFRHLLRLPMSYFMRRQLADVMSRFDAVDSVKKILTEGLVASLVDSVLVLVTGIFMVLYAPWLTLVAVAAVLLYFVTRWALYGSLRSATEDALRAGAVERGLFMESIRGVQALKIFGKEVERLTMWQNRLADAVNAQVQVERRKLLYAALNGSIFHLETILVVYLGAQAIMAQTFTVGMLFAFLAYKQQFSARAVGLVEKLIEFRMLEVHLERVSDIVGTSPEDGDERDGGASESLRGALSVRRVSYRHGADEPRLFEDLSFDVAAGESVAIVGPSGCGKTTLLKLMLGLIAPEDGVIAVDGADLQRLGTRHYRRHVAAVMQDDQLVSGSLAENIAFSGDELDMDRVRECARLAAIDEDIAKMPMDYETQVGDMGLALSGGQRQRLLLARALYRRPRILFLDEATSHLDVALEAAINRSIAALDITRVIIAHRPETIRSADRVIDLGQAQAALYRVEPPN